MSRLTWQQRAWRANNGKSDIRCSITWHLSQHENWRVLAYYDLSLKIAKRQEEDGRRFLWLSQRAFIQQFGGSFRDHDKTVQILVDERLWVLVEKGGMRQSDDGTWEGNRRPGSQQLNADRYEVIDSHQELVQRIGEGRCFSSVTAPPTEDSPRPVVKRGWSTPGRTKAELIELFKQLQQAVRRETGQKVFFPRDHHYRLRQMMNGYSDDHVIQTVVRLAQNETGPTFQWRLFSAWLLPRLEIALAVTARGAKAGAL